MAVRALKMVSRSKRRLRLPNFEKGEALLDPRTSNTHLGIHGNCVGIPGDHSAVFGCGSGMIGDPTNLVGVHDLTGKVGRIVRSGRSVRIVLCPEPEVGAFLREKWELAWRELMGSYGLPPKEAKGVATMLMDPILTRYRVSRP